MKENTIEIPIWSYGHQAAKSGSQTHITIAKPPTKESGSYRLLFEFLIEADGYPMAEDLGAKIVEHLPLPGWVDGVKFVGIQVDE